LTPPNAACDPTNNDVGSRPRGIDERQERQDITLLSIGNAVIITDARGTVTLLTDHAMDRS
jgi:hypothetical protein